MTGSGTSRFFWRFFCAAAIVAPIVVALSAATIGTARADDGQTPTGAGAVQQAPAAAPGSFPVQPAPANKPGFLHQLEVWWNDGFADFNAKMKSAKDKLEDYNKQQDKAAKETSAATEQALKDAAQATKDAATAVVKLPITRVFEFHDRCQVAGNGAPDCQTTATNACRAKGFASGQPLDISTSQECPARVMLSGRPPVEGECKDVTVVLRAVCR
jgi:hypothetical protein